MSINESNGLVWKRPSLQESGDDDVWDDRALIDAYDKAVRRVNQQIASSRNIQVNSDKQMHNTVNVGHEWRLGQHCRCVYREDGIEYEAKIVSIDVHNNSCVVRYIGYGNEEDKSLSELKHTLGKVSRKLQSQLDPNDVSHSNSDTDNDINHFSKHKVNSDFQPRSQPKTNSPSTCSWFMPSGSTDHNQASQPIPPPPLPFEHDSHLPNDDESLASMLMSWYMSGYHTGYYRALKQFKLNCKCNK